MFVRGCEKFVIALAYLFCLALVGSCLLRFAYFLADLCTKYKQTLVVCQDRCQDHLLPRGASATVDSETKRNIIFPSKGSVNPTSGRLQKTNEEVA